MVQKHFEHGLIDAIQPIRYMALAQALHQLADTGLYRALAVREVATAADLAADFGLDEERLLAYFQYLANEGYLTEDGGWRLTDKAVSLEPYLPWYSLLVGGYAGTFGQIGQVLKADAGWASRNGAYVGAGSCGMSRYDALPLANGLLDRIASDQELTVVDLGCGDAACLIELARARPEIRAIGVEPDPDSVLLAKELVERSGISDRVTVYQGTTADALHLDLPRDGSLCFLTSFVLQEMLEQEGEESVRALLATALSIYPRAHWLVVEVDHQPTDRKVMAHGLGLSYYNPYFLLHAITEQRLIEKTHWEAIFAAAGAEVVALAHPPTNVDSTDLELGYLLRSAAR